MKIVSIIFAAALASVPTLAYAQKGFYDCSAQGDPGTCFEVNSSMSNGTAIWGHQTANPGWGVFGDGVRGVKGGTYVSWGFAGVEGEAAGAGDHQIGVYGSSLYGPGVKGQTNNRDGVYGTVVGDPVAGQLIPSGVRGERFGAGFQGAGVLALAHDSHAYALYAWNDAGTSSYAGYFQGTLYADRAVKPNGGTWGVFSDARLKKDVEPLKDALARLLKLRGVTFDWIEPDGKNRLPGRHMGLIAQEVEKVFPTWVSQDPEGFKIVAPVGVEALMVESLRTLQNEIDELRKQRAEVSPWHIGANVWRLLASCLAGTLVALGIWAFLGIRARLLGGPSAWFGA